jgi:hypothetical protein
MEREFKREPSSLLWPDYVFAFSWRNVGRLVYSFRDFRAVSGAGAEGPWQVWGGGGGGVRAGMMEAWPERQIAWKKLILLVI